MTCRVMADGSPTVRLKADAAHCRSTDFESGLTAILRCPPCSFLDIPEYDQVIRTIGARNARAACGPNGAAPSQLLGPSRRRPASSRPHDLVGLSLSQRFFRAGDRLAGNPPLFKPGQLSTAKRFPIGGRRSRQGTPSRQSCPPSQAERRMPCDLSTSSARRAIV
jgi:hypothetical protein